MQDDAARFAASNQLNEAKADLAAIRAAACATSADLQDVISSVNPAMSEAGLAEDRRRESTAAASVVVDVDRHLHGLLSWTRRAMDSLKDAAAEHVRCLETMRAMTCASPCCETVQTVRDNLSMYESLICSEAHPVACQVHLREAEEASVAEARSLREHLSVVELAMHHQQRAATEALRCCCNSSGQPGT